MLRVRAVAALIGVFVLSAAIRTAAAEPISVTWHPNPSGELVLGYVVSVETPAGAVLMVQDVGNQTSFVYPDAVAGQEYFFRIAAYNVLGTGPASAQVSAFSNAPPTLIHPGNRTSTVGDTVALQLNGSDPYGEAVTYSIDGLPPGLALAAGTGLISGTATTAGIYSVETTAFDGLLSTSQSFSWLIDGGPPSVTIVSPTSEPTHSTGSATIVIGGTASDELAIAALTWANDRGGTGTVNGTNFWSTPAIPLFVGTNVITITVRDTAGHTAIDALSVTSPGTPAPNISIAAPTSASTFTTSSDQVAMSGTATDSVGVTSVTWANNRGGSGTATVTQKQGVYSWSVAQVLLQPGANVITITASNASGNTRNAVLTVTWNQVPVITTPGSLTGLQGVASPQALTAADPEGGALAWSAANLPPGITINASTGALSGTATTLGAFNVTISVSDGTSTAQALFTWTIISPIPGPASPVSPSGSISTTTPSFSWAAVGVATYYLLSIDDGSAASPIHAWYTPAQAGCGAGTGSCTVAAPRALTSGRVRWMVLTWSPYGYGPWSNAMETIVDLADGATPTPTALEPSGPVGTRSPSYSWSPVTGAIWYQLSVTDALNGTKLFWFEPEYICPASTCVVAPNLLLATGTAQWQVRAWRASGAGAWSAPVSFETADAAPGKATLIAPSSPVPSSTPTFTWNAVIGTSYYLLRAVDRDNVEIERWYRPHQVGCPLGTGTCSASPGGTIHPGPANWRVLTWNGSGYGPWSDPFNFTVEIPDPAAGVPQTISPNGTIATPNATYKWTAVTGAVSYRLSISSNEGPEDQWWLSPGAADCLVSAECTVVPQAGLESGTATWRVQAWTVNGHSAWSAPVTLTVSIPAPTAPVLVSPNGATSTTPPFVWNASPNATLYYVQVYDATGLRVDRWLSLESVGCPGGTGSCTLNAGLTMNAGAGSWRVIAWNSSGYSPWSSAMSFAVP